MTEKTIVRRWFNWLLPHVTGSEEGQKKNSCAESFYLLLSRTEATVLHNFFSNPMATLNNEEWEALNKTAHALEKLLGNK